MKLVFLTHPSFLGSQSMSRFASMLSDGMARRGHQVQVWAPKARFFALPLPGGLKKWMGYVDQYIIFRWEVWNRVRQCPKDTLLIFTDQALGPWVPWIGNRPHVIHCHDFLAQRSALGQIPENPTKWFGRQYQAYIRRGYSKGKNFISVSKKTQSDLSEFLPHHPQFSEMVYNGLDPLFKPGKVIEARALLSEKLNTDLATGYLLHVGGNQWYKNRAGVIAIFNAFKKETKSNIPLLLLGQQPSPDLLQAYQSSEFRSDIHFKHGNTNEIIKTAYEGASLFLFPSLAEGFGWPIAEAMACGCPVVTTNQAPMTEVAGDAGFLIPKMPYSEPDKLLWAQNAARVIKQVISFSPEELKAALDAGELNAKRFNQTIALDLIEKMYSDLNG